MKVLVLSANGFEDSELTVPVERLREAGMQVDIGSFVVGPIRGKHGETVRANRALSQIWPEDYDALLLPGGKAPEVLRQEPQVLAAVRQFFEAGKPVAAICHGPQILISAGVMAGRTATAYRAVASELKAAGAHYRDAEVVVDGNLVTSRTPADLGAFTREFLKQLESVARTAQPVS
jgi:protease I